MKSKLLDSGAQKTWAVILDTGDEGTDSLLRFAEEHELGAAAFTGLSDGSAVGGHLLQAYVRPKDRWRLSRNWPDRSRS